MNDETYSLDKLATVAITVEWLTSRHNKKGFDQNSLVQIYSSDQKHKQTNRHTSQYIETPHTMYGASENLGIII